jgi:UDP-2,3-diacylglucosamine hydrolase
MTTLFISDLHLHSSRPEVTRCFVEFLRHAENESVALYILGDLFEAWLGDDDPDSHNRSVIDALKQYTNSGKPCYFARGNRDFLIGQRFCRETGIELLPETTVIDMYGHSVLIMHGDELCTDDHEYQKYRSFVRHPLFKLVSDVAPMWLRRRIGSGLRSASQKKLPLKPVEITDVNPDSVARFMRENGVTILLHGHTHRPGIHELLTDNGTATRIVLGDWYTQGSVLEWTPDGYELRRINYSDDGSDRVPVQ